MIAAVSVVLKATALLALATLVHALLRQRGSAAARHLVWTSVLAALLALPLAEAALPHWTMALPIAIAAKGERKAVAVGPRPSALPSVGPERDAPATNDRPATLAVRSGRNQSEASHQVLAVALLYAAGAILLLLRLAWSSFTLRCLSRASCEITDPAWRRLLDESTRQLGIGRRVRLLRTRAEIIPITFGTRRPAVMVPASADTWSEDRRRAVLLHELAHVGRADCLAHVVGVLTCALYWPHPGVWFAVRHLRVERELACDDRVLAAGEEPQTYADNLLELARSLGVAPAPASALAMARARDLETRLRAIVDESRNRASLPRWGRSAAVAAAVAIALTMATLRARITDAPAAATRLATQPAMAAARALITTVQGAEDLSGSWEVRLSADGSSAHLTVRTAHSSRGETIPTSRLEAVAGVRITGVSGSVRFAIRRDQGMFAGEGTCRDAVCTGTASFQPDPAFVAGLAKRGIGAPSPLDTLQLALHDVGFEFIDEIVAAWNTKPDIQALVRAAQHGVGLSYVREMTALGYRLETLDALIRLRDHGVDPAYVRGLAENGMAQLSADDLVRARDHGIDPSYVRGMRELGLGSFDLDGLVEARNHGVDPTYARGLGELGYTLSLGDLFRAREHGIDPTYVLGLVALGYKELSLDTLIGLRSHGVDPTYASDLAALGYTGLSLDTLVNLRGHGVDPTYVSDLARLGYTGLSLATLINLRSHGVDPTYVSGLAGLGYAALPLDTLMGLRQHGVDPEYVRRLKEKGVTGLTPEQLIDRRDRGLDDPAVVAREMLAALRPYWRSLVGH
jgi:beta-lactamase regulating signal transducer with metallopeptidase domain